jgi:hypothetical protein
VGGQQPGRDQPPLLLCAVLVLTPPLSGHIARVMSGERTSSTRDAGEATMSHLTQMAGPATQNFVSAGSAWAAGRSSPASCVRPTGSRSTSSPTVEGGPMARTDRNPEIDGEGAFWAVAGFAASVLVGVGLRPLRESAGLENVVVVYVIVVALTAAVGGRAAGLASSLSAALAYTWFFTTPYETLVIVPEEDRPILRTTRLGIAATAHALANAS